jgi:hypothetical protein
VLFFIKQSPQDHLDCTDIVFRVALDTTWSEVMDDFVRFLTACTFAPPLRNALVDWAHTSGAAIDPPSADR